MLAFWLHLRVSLFFSTTAHSVFSFSTGLSMQHYTSLSPSFLDHSYWWCLWAETNILLEVALGRNPNSSLIIKSWCLVIPTISFSWLQTSATKCLCISASQWVDLHACELVVHLALLPQVATQFFFSAMNTMLQTRLFLRNFVTSPSNRLPFLHMPSQYRYRHFQSWYQVPYTSPFDTHLPAFCQHCTITCLKLFGMFSMFLPFPSELSEVVWNKQLA